MLRRLLLAALAAVVGCDGSSSVPLDAPRGLDARVRDAGVVDAPCGGDQPFAAQLADFDFTDATPTTVAGATLTVQSLPSRTAVSAADGVVEMCVPVESDDMQKLDVDAPGDFLDGFVIASPDASRIGSRAPLLLRLITLERASVFYSAQVGAAFDATRAHVIVLNACDGNEPVLDRPHGTIVAAQQDVGDEVVWNTGSIGRYVLFPNVEVTQPTGSVSWSFGRTRVIPLEAGRWTMVVDCIWWL